VAKARRRAPLSQVILTRSEHLSRQAVAMMNHDEARRIGELRSYGVLDTSPDIAFDRLTSLACDLFDAPIALVTLIDEERQWFKSRRGLGARSTPREQAFCRHAIDLGPDAVMVVEDATLDPRFAANPFVVGEPGIRFYAGAVLTSPSGFNLGALCVIDTKPRDRPSDRDLDRLRALAQIAVDEMERLRVNRLRGEQARLLQLVETMSGVGHWRYDHVTGEISWSDLVYAIHGVDPRTYKLDVETALAGFHPDDRDRVVDQISTAIATKGTCDVQARLIRADGQARIVQSKAGCEFDAAGAVINVFGTVVDITARVEAEAARAEDEARYHAMSDRVLLATQAGQIGIWERNIVTNALTWDDRMYALYGLERGEALTAERFTGCIHPDDRASALASVRATLQQGAPFDTEFRIIRPDGETRSIRAQATLVRAADGSPQRMVGTNWDVTAVRSLEFSLRASESRARSIIANAHQAIVTADEAGRITGWNRHAELTFGWSAAEAIGADLTMILPVGHAGVAAFLGGALGEDIDLRVERAARRKDGREISIELAVGAERTASGWEMTALMHDISERKAQLELFENAFEHAAIGEALVGLDGAFLKVNPTLCAMLGYSKDELRALDFQAITHPEDLAADLNFVNALHDGLISTYRMEKRLFRKDGSIIWIHLVVSRVDNPDGSPRHYISQIEDFTARREAKAALKDSEARYRLIAENTTDMILTADLDGKITFVAASCQVLTGYTPAEMMGRSAADLACPDERARVRRVYRNLLKGAAVERVRWRVLHKTAGHDVWLESNPSLLRDPLTDAPTGFLDVIREITQQVGQEEALAAARAEAEAAATVKGEFLANMSHEIRTPLTAVIGFSGLLNQRPELDEVSRRFVHRVSSAGQALLAIVNDILDFSKLEAGQVEITRCPVSPLAVAEDALALFAPQADAKGLWLECEAEGDLPDSVMIDADRVRQVLLNLVGNAVKFTDHGSVRLVVGYDADGERLRLRVEDTGAGMDADQQQKLFQRFSQVDASSTRKHGGTGLGLAICKGLTEAMGGVITVSSVLGAGSTFALDIAAPRATPPGEAEEAREEGGGWRLDGVRVLVVDDNAVNRELARAVLESFGSEVGEAASGRAAVEAASLEPFDCILMDLRMPGLSGMEALLEIRAAQGPNQDVPILAFTADPDRGRLGELQAFDGLVSKPILAMDLVSAVSASTRWDETSAGAATSQDVVSA
jgi:PAS domain S-box-containing protein